jgi:hypothetical protein
VINRLIRENEALKQQRSQLDRSLKQCEASRAAQARQIENLGSFSDERPFDLFAPTSIEILSLSGGRDFDQRPGQDGVVVYVRPRDAAGDAVKAPGRIAVQLLDNTDLAAPRVIGKCEFADAQELNALWHGRFLTYHFTLECRFPDGVSLPSSGRLTISVRFDDYLTGRALTAVREISFVPPGAPE